MTSHLVEHIQNPENLKGFQQERLLLDVASLIYRTMQHQGVSRKELAEKLEVTKGRITQYLGGEKNLTLRTLADIFTALRSTLVVDAKDLTFDGSSESPDRRACALFAFSEHAVSPNKYAVNTGRRISLGVTGAELDVTSPQPLPVLSSAPSAQPRITANG